MLKKKLREKYLEKRKTLSIDEVNFLSDKIFEKFILQFNVSENQNVHVFLPISKLNEINTFSFIKQLWKMKINVFVPKIHQNKNCPCRTVPSQQKYQENAALRRWRG